MRRFSHRIDSWQEQTGHADHESCKVEGHKPRLGAQDCQQNLRRLVGLGYKRLQGILF